MNGYVAPHPVAPRVGLFAADGLAGSAGEGGILPSTLPAAAAHHHAITARRRGRAMARPRGRLKSPIRL